MDSMGENSNSIDKLKRRDATSIAEYCTAVNRAYSHATERHSKVVPEQEWPFPSAAAALLVYGSTTLHFGEGTGRRVAFWCRGGMSRRHCAGLRDFMLMPTVLQ